MSGFRGISTGLYGWMERFKRDGIPYDWDLLYRSCAEAGLDAVETDATPEKLKIVRSYGLAVSASYIGLPLHKSFESLDVERTVLPFAERLAAAGGKDLLLNADWVAGDAHTPGIKTEEQFQRQGDHLSRIAERVRPFGLRVAMHNHAARRENAEGDLRSVIRYADPAVGLCVDTGWAKVAGCDPVAWVQDYPERLFAVHLRNQRGSIPTEDLLEGDLDMSRLLEATRGAGYEGWLTLELWHPDTMQPLRSMVEDARRSAEALRRQ